MRLFIIIATIWLITPIITIAITHNRWIILFIGMIWCLLPIMVQWIIADRSLKPPWYKPGRQPRMDTRNTSTSTSSSSSHSISPTPTSDHAGELDADASVREREFENAITQHDDVGLLGSVLGAAIQHYDGRITNPLIDFDLPFEHVTIVCESRWMKKKKKMESIGNMIEAATHSTTRTRSNSNKRVSSSSSVVANKRRNSNIEISNGTISDPSRTTNTIPITPPPPPSSVYHLRGWYIPSPRARTLILLIHGAARDRRTFMRHTPHFHEAGYATLLIDCREHGTSSGTSIGTGFTTREAMDVIHAARYGRHVLGFERIVACGTSQGAAACIVAAVLADEIQLETEVKTQRQQHNNNTSSSSSSSRRNSQSNESDSLLSSSSSSTQSPSSSSSFFPSTISSSTSSSPPIHLIDAVIAENPYLSRESCIGDLMSRMLGHIPHWAFPLWCTKRLFMIGTLLMVRWRLGLFRFTRIDQWWMNIKRASSTSEGTSIRDETKRLNSRSPSASFQPFSPLFASDSLDELRHLAIDDFNPIDLISRLSPRPLLLMHGLADDIIPPIHSQLLYSRARDPKKLWLVDQARHTALINQDEKGWRHTVVSFLSHHGL